VREICPSETSAKKDGAFAFPFAAPVRNPLMINPFVWLVLQLISIYTWIVIIAVVVSWLVAFGVINVYNHVARGIVQSLDAITEPVFRQVRRVIPPIGGLDLSPLIVLIALQFLSYLITYYSIYL
jgi:YggT family protein